MATLVKRAKVTLIYSGSLSDSQSDHDQSDSEPEDCSPTKPDLDSSQEDSSDNSEAEPETPPLNSRNHGNRFKHRRDIPEDSQVIQSPHHHSQLKITRSIDIGEMFSRTSLKDTRRRIVLSWTEHHGQSVFNLLLTPGGKRLLHKFQIRCTPAGKQSH